MGLGLNSSLLGEVFWGAGGVPPPKNIVINLLGTYAKLPCKEELDRFSDSLNPYPDLFIIIK